GPYYQGAVQGRVSRKSRGARSGAAENDIVCEGGLGTQISACNAAQGKGKRGLGSAFFVIVFSMDNSIRFEPLLTPGGNRARKITFFAVQIFRELLVSFRCQLFTTYSYCHRMYATASGPRCREIALSVAEFDPGAL